MFPFLVPFKKWRSEHRNLRPRDIVLVFYGKTIGKGEYWLGRVLRVFPDVHGRVRTVTVGLRKRDRREASFPYKVKPLDEITLGVQRLAVILPVEEQITEASETDATEIEVKKSFVEKSDVCKSDRMELDVNESEVIVSEGE